jgi:hypothetical protein
MGASPKTILLVEIDLVARKIFLVGTFVVHSSYNAQTRTRSKQIRFFFARLNQRINIIKEENVSLLLNL